MADLMQIRRRILLDEPQILEAVGKGVSFFADRSAALKQCILSLNAWQEGSGTPSKTNVRHIITHKDFTVYHSDGEQTNEYSYSWVSRRSGGYLNLLTGIVYTTGGAVVLDGETGWSAVGSKFYYNLRDTAFNSSTSMADQLCNMYPFGGISEGGSARVTEDKHFYLQRVASTLNYCRVWVYDTDYDLEGFKTFLSQNALEVTYPVTPSYVSTYHATMRTFVGQNQIWESEGGQFTVKYWTH